MVEVGAGELTATWGRRSLLGKTMMRAWDWRWERGAITDRFLSKHEGHLGGGVAGFGQ